MQISLSLSLGESRADFAPKLKIQRRPRFACESERGERIISRYQARRRAYHGDAIFSVGARFSLGGVPRVKRQERDALRRRSTRRKARAEEEEEEEGEAQARRKDLRGTSFAGRLARRLAA